MTDERLQQIEQRAEAGSACWDDPIGDARWLIGQLRDARAGNEALRLRVDLKADTEAANADLEHRIDVVTEERNAAWAENEAARLRGMRAGERGRLWLARELQDAEVEVERLKHQLASDQADANCGGYTAGYSAAVRDCREDREALAAERDEARAKIEDYRKTVEYFDLQSKRRMAERDELRAEVDELRLRHQDAEALARKRGHELEALSREAERLQRGGAELGRIMERHGRWLVDATHSQDVIGEDGDGDWAVVWERLAQLGARADAAEVGLAEAEARLRDEEAKLAAIHRLHNEEEVRGATARWWQCSECHQPVPCVTVRALDGERETDE